MTKKLQPDDYRSLTFDCYATLIDWESGITNCPQPILTRHDVHVIDEFVLELFGAIEPQVQAEGGLYAEVLEEVLHVAQSLYDDIAPASELGLDTVWINRTGTSAARSAPVESTWTFGSLRTFAEAIT